MEDEQGVNLNEIQSSCTKTIPKYLDSTENGITIIADHGSLSYPSMFPSSLLEDLSDSNHEDVRHLL